MINNRVKTGVKCLDETLNGGLPEGSMTLIAGNPGTGKTLLSGEFLYEGAQKGENVLYVSLSEGRRSFLEYMARVGHDFTAEPVRDHLKVMDLVTVKEEGLDILIEMVTSHMEQAETRRLVIDSFTAMSNAFTETIDARVTLHILSKILSHGQCTTLLITEIPTGTDRIGLGVEEFVADGIMMLRRHMTEGNLLRELEITKMRGTRITRPQHVFTLHNGFTVLPQYSPKQVQEPRKYRHHPNTLERFSSGNPRLDEVLGGLRRGDTVYIELCSDIAPTIPALLLGPLRANFIANNQGCIFLPPGGESSERIARFDRQYGHDPDTYSDLVKVATTGQEGMEEPHSLRLDPNDLGVSHRIWREEARRLMTATGEPVLKIIYVDNANNIWPRDQTRRMLDTESKVTRYEESLLVLLSRPGPSTEAQHASSLAHTHLRVSNHQGVILMHGVKPKTPLYALEQDNSHGYPSLTLTPLY
ncbi:MAG: AAA family ATPase [Candidatus Bathyarchaeota archaeon]|nr:AAA family ATPase [Candidatus Bathyarchaeota archaeon]